MTDNVIVLPVQTTLDLPISRIVDNFPRDAECCVIVGRTADGELYFASSLGDSTKTNWLLDLAKKALLSHG